jgi:hypothetical protein
MKEYHFQYTITKKTLVVILLSIATFISSELLGIYLNLNLILVLAISFYISFLLFTKLKKKAVNNCKAQLGDTYLTLEFKNKKTTVYFDDLTSYKVYYGKSGTTFNLKIKNEKLRISVNNNYCPTSEFDLFCKDTITQIKYYKEGNTL